MNSKEGRSDVLILAVLQIPKEVREARRDELISLQQRIGQDHAASLVGQEVICSFCLRAL